MKAQRFLKNNNAQVAMETAWLLALVGFVCVVALGPMRKSLGGFFFGKSNEMSTLKYDADSKGHITTKTISNYQENNLKGAVDQIYTTNTNEEDTNLTANRN